MRNKFFGLQSKQIAGIYTVAVALMLVALLGFVGLAIDVARHLVVQQELQNAVDACALAAVQEIDGTQDGLKRATVVGKYVGGARNFVDFQRATLIAQSVESLNVGFASSIGNKFPSVSDGAVDDSKFVKCSAEQNRRPNFFMKILGFEYSDVASSAIATMQPAMVTCSAPIAITANEPTAPYYGYKKYEMFVLNKTTKGDTPPVSPPSFAFADVNPNASKISGSFQMFEICQIKTNSTDCIEMNPDSAQVDIWNSRFGIYEGGLKPPYKDPQVTLPDRTGKVFTAYDQTSISGYQEAIKSMSPFVAPKKVNIGNSDALALTYGKANARLIVFPVVQKNTNKTNCPEKGNVIGWACGLMMNPYKNGANLDYPYDNARIMFLGSLNDSTTPASKYCGTSGIPGKFSNIGPLVPSLVQ